MAETSKDIESCQKDMEIDKNQDELIVIDKEAQPEQANSDKTLSNGEERMDAQNTDDLKIIAYEKGDYLVLGLENEEVNDNEKDVCLTREDFYKYIELKTVDLLSKSDYDHVQPYNLRIAELMDKIKDAHAEYAKILSIAERIYCGQEKLLRDAGVFEKLSCASVASQVNLSDADWKSVVKTEKPDSTPKDSQNSKPDDTPQQNSETAEKNPTEKAASNKPQENKSDIVCIDLTDEMQIARNSAGILKAPVGFTVMKHPAPLPPRPLFNGNEKSLPPIPPKPRLKISAEDRGIVLQWDLSASPQSTKVSSFDIFGYQEQASSVINTLLWKKIGNVAAMTLPMACTLTQFVEGNRYHFSVRAVDSYGRCGSYSDPISITYQKK